MRNFFLSRRFKAIILASFFTIIIFFVWNVPMTYIYRKNASSFYVSDKYSIQLAPGSKIRSTETFMSRVVYNRVGKCGSRTVQNILKVVAEKNLYNFYISPVSNDTRPKTIDLIKEVKLIDSIPSPMLYSRHIHYVSFSKYGAEKPIYINIVRDPIERFSSNYHFKRFGDQIESRGRQVLQENQLLMDVNECILNNHTECMPARLWYIIPYFCGQAAFCRIPSVEALRRAKLNVMENYLVVGILEDFESTLRVFEKMLPRHFEGSLEVYRQMQLDPNKKNTSTVGKKKINSAAYKVLRKRMELDYEFYYFIVGLFKNLKKKLRI